MQIVPILMDLLGTLSTESAQPLYVQMMPVHFQAVRLDGENGFILFIYFYLLLRWGGWLSETIAACTQKCLIPMLLILESSPDSFPQ